MKRNNDLSKESISGGVVTAILVIAFLTSFTIAGPEYFNLD
jgi:hypothetical protein